MFRQIAGKAVMILLKKDVLQAAASLQLCGGQVAGSEAMIHAMMMSSMMIRRNVFY